MSSEKRLVIFTVVTFLSILGIQYGLEVSGLVPPPPPKKPQAPVARLKPGADKEGVKAKGDEPVKPVAVAAADAPGASGAPGADGGVDKEKTRPKGSEAAAASPEELTLGSRKNTGPKGFHMEVRFDQKGAGVASLTSALYEAEFVEGQRKHQPLVLLRRDPKFPAPPSLSITLVTPRDPSVDDAAAAAAGVATPGGGELPLDATLWEVIRDARGKAVRAVSRAAQGKAAAVEGQEIAFRTKDGASGLVVTKTYRLFPGEDGFELDLTFTSPDKTQAVVYKLLGPHGIPIEGEWYTGTFRDAIFGMVEGAGTKITTLAAYDIAKRKDNPERFQTLPLRYTGIENQYFAAVVKPVYTPGSGGERWESETVPLVLHDDAENHQKADIGVAVTSNPVPVGPNAPATHTYRVFVGPKTVEALAPFGAEDLALYRKSNWIPFAPLLAQKIITPLLAGAYDVTRAVARFFGRKGGNYGVAIILLTMLVRLAMFPLGRKAAMAAKKMQDLQPLLKEIQEKHKEDKELQTKETWALYKRQGVNPVGGCLPALIQLPIFVGLWQALNNSVHLRHASFLYIENLAAPDMLFKFPTTLPLLGDYFNVLPFLVVSLMLVQTKLFSPPATTPEAEAQQKMMKYMMVFMAFMFYKVPSGLGIYFITSSLWQICERLLLPKVTPATVKAADPDDRNPPGGGNGRGGNGNNGPAKPPGKFARFMEKVLDEASKNQTYRKLSEEKAPDHDRDRRDKGKPRSRPGKRR